MHALHKDVGGTPDIQILPSGENFGNHICNTDNVISLNKEIYCSNAMSEVTELKSFIYIYIFFL